MFVATSSVSQPLWHDGQPFNFLAKMTDGLADRQMRIQRPIIGLIEFAFRRQHACLRGVFETRADNRWHKHL